MGIKASLKDRSVVPIAASLVVIAMAVYMMRNAMSGTSGIRTRAYFTTDDGQTQFVDSMDHFPPFDHGGKTAYRVWMYSTDGGKTSFPVYLERYTPQGKARISAEYEDFKAGKTHTPPTPSPGDTEIKKPGPGNPWVSRADLAEVQKIIRFDVPPNAAVEVQLPE
jgi:hypothetical protein